MKKSNKHYAIMVAVAAGVFSILSAMFVNSLGLFFLPVTTEFGISMTAMSLSVVIQCAAFAICLPLINKIINKYDLRLVLTISVILYACGFAMRALSKSIIGFYISSAILGNCWVIFVSLLGPMIANNWFAKHVATVIGLISICTNLGGFLFNALGGWIIQIYGWRTCYWIWTAISIVVGLPFAIFAVRKTPEEMGLQPYGIEDAENDSMKISKRIGLDAKIALKTPAFWFIGLAIGLDSFGDTFSTYISPYAQMLGATAIVGGLMASFVQFGGMAGKIFLGPLCDKNPRSGAFFTNICGVLGFVGMIIMGRMGFSVTFYAVMCVIYGFAYSASNIGFTSLTRDVFGPKDFNKIWPSLNIFLGLIAAFGATVFGLVIDYVGYGAAPYVVALIYLLAVVCVILAAQSGKKYKSQWTEEQ